MNKSTILNSLNRENSLDLIQDYVMKKANITSFDKNNISDEMFKLFFNVIELGKEIRIRINDNSNNSEAKIADIFLVLISICNNLNINLFDALKKQNI